MTKNKDFVNIVAKIISFLLNVVITFFVTSFVIKNVGAESYGFVGLANEFISYAQIFTFALNSMASRFVTMEYENKNNQSVEQYFASLLVSNIVISMIIAIIGSGLIINLEKIINISNANIFDVKFLWFILLSNFILTLIGTLFQIATFCKKRLELEAIRTAIACVIKAIILVICFKLFKPYIWYIGMATLMSNLYSFIYNIKYTKYLLPDVRVSTKAFDKYKVRTLLKAGVWNSLTQLGTVLSSGLDLLVTNIFVGDYCMGIMSVSKTVPKYLLAFISTVSGVFTPDFVIKAAHDDREQMLKQLKMSMKLMSVFTLVPIIILVTMGKNLYTLWVPSINTNDIYLITLVAAIGYLIVMPIEPVWGIYTALNKIKVSSIYLLIESFLNVGIELVGMQFVNSNIAKMLVIIGVTAVLQIIRAFVFIPLYTEKCLGMPTTFMYEIQIKNLVVFLVVTVFGAFILRVFSTYTWISLMLGSVIVGALALVACFLVILDKDERQMIILKITRLRQERSI